MGNTKTDTKTEMWREIYRKGLAYENDGAKLAADGLDMVVEGLRLRGEAIANVTAKHKAKYGSLETFLKAHLNDLQSNVEFKVPHKRERSELVWCYNNPDKVAKARTLKPMVNTAKALQGEWNRYAKAEAIKLKADGKSIEHIVSVLGEPKDKVEGWLSKPKPKPAANREALVITLPEELRANALIADLLAQLQAAIEAVAGVSKPEPEAKPVKLKPEAKAPKPEPEAKASKREPLVINPKYCRAAYDEELQWSRGKLTIGEWAVNAKFDWSDAIRNGYTYAELAEATGFSTRALRNEVKDVGSFEEGMVEASTDPNEPDQPQEGEAVELTTAEATKALKEGSEVVLGDHVRGKLIDGKLHVSAFDGDFAHMADLGNGASAIRQFAMARGYSVRGGFKLGK